MRIMGLDLGTKTIGVAVSDLLGLTAQGIKTINRTQSEEDLSQLKELITEYEVTKIVLGLPKNMDGTIGPQGEKVLAFQQLLKGELALEVELQDERLSTVEAERFLITADLRRGKRKKVIDKLAATIILQSYLDRSRK